MVHIHEKAQSLGVLRFLTFCAMWESTPSLHNIIIIASTKAVLSHI